MAQDETLGKAKAYRSAKYHSAKARASAKKVSDTKKPTSSNSDIKSLLAGAPKSASSIKKEEPSFWDGVGDALNTPVIKGIIDAISVGTYAAGNATDQLTGTNNREAPKDATGAAQRIAGDIASKANPGIAAAAKGVMGAFGVDEFQKTQSDSIKKVQKNNNIDTESDASKGVQFWGGLAGDIALDPLTYAGVGLATNAVRGAAQDQSWLGGDSDYTSQIAEYDRALQTFVDRIMNQKKMFNQDADDAVASTGRNQAMSLDALGEDFGARGLSYSGMFDTTKNQTNERFNDAKGGIEKVRGRNLTDADNREADYRTENQISRGNAERSSLSRQAQRQALLDSMAGF